MPELPEVEVVRRGLEPYVGAVIEGVEVFDERAVTRHLGGGADLEARLTGRALRMPGRRGKFLWVPLSGPREALLVHLGMSGQLLVDTASRTAEGRHRHERVRIWLSGDRELAFVDQRTFGSLALDPFVDDVPSQVAHIARDPLDPAFSDREFVTRLRARRTEVKRALLDQTLVSGIGNIYADEALWAARVHPQQPTATISAIAAGRVIAAAREVMLRALAEGGTSFDALYVNVNGQSGYFSRSLRAYGRDGEPCSRCGTLIRRILVGGRSSHFCPRCQRLR